MSATSPAPRQRRKLPSYRKHKGTGQAFIQVRGRRHYLGKHGSPASWQEYDKWIEVLEKERSQEEGAPKQVRQHLDAYAFAASVRRVTVEILLIAYWKHADEHYRKHGEPTSTIANITPPLRRLRERHGELLAEQFGPLKLKALRETWVKDGLAAKTVNEYAGAVKRVFYWGVENELIPPAIKHGLSAVRGVRGDGKRVQPVEDEIVELTLPYLPPVVADMVQLQRLSGARPHEICDIKKGQIKRRAERAKKRVKATPLFPGEPQLEPSTSEDDVWEYRPGRHKTEHHGRGRLILFGPRAQAILRPYLTRGDEDYLFSPAESEKKRRITTARTDAPAWTPKSRYTSASYRRAVARACERAFEMPRQLRRIGRKPPGRKPSAEVVAAWEEKKQQLQREAAAWRKENVWKPNQLRHTAGTEIRAKYGLEVAQVVLGHAHANTTEIYAEPDVAKAKVAARDVG